MPPSTPDRSDELPGDTAFQEAVERAAADPDVVGAILVGSRAIGPPFVRDGSDWDLRLVVRDEALDAADARHATPHGSIVEVALIRLGAFESMADPDSPAAWDRPSYLHAVLVEDRLEGGIRMRLDALAGLEPEAARRLAATALDGYVNSYHRSRKNAIVGLTAESHLDAAESVAPLLTFLFAVHGRVRPFNRHLGFDLRTEPLGDGWLAADALLPRLDELVASGSPASQAALFCDVEALARAHGHGHVIDSWEPDVPSLRGGAAPLD
ncbi:MAG TPA: hypothetical protein VF494_08650 [Candidatus Limnocylindrales bacterium]